MPELDAIRGLAILGVVLYHLFYWVQDLRLFSHWQRIFLLSMSPGQFGVNLFFVLSGFLITGILIESKSTTKYYTRFYFRRALRILPAYYFTLFLLVLLGLTSRGFLLMSCFYCSNLSGLFGIALSYTVLWSLAVEEHYYLLWPFAVKRFSPSRLMWLLSAIILASPLSRLLYHLHAFHNGLSNATYGYYTWNNADGLALGSFMAILIRRPGWRRQELRNLSVGLLVLAILIAAAGYPHILSRTTALGEALQVVPWNLASGALLGSALLLGSSSKRRFVSPPPLVFLGHISYGLYLYHLIFLSAYGWATQRLHFQAWWNATLWQQLWLRAVVAGVAAITFSYLSREYFEDFFLRLKNTSRSSALNTISTSA